MKKLFVFLGSLSLPLSALAHPGDHYEAAWYHVLQSPFHLFPLVLVVIGLGYYVAKKIYSKK